MQCFSSFAIFDVVSVGVGDVYVDPKGQAKMGNQPFYM